jgi:hypothetical protein
VEPTPAELTETIIAVHGRPDDKAFIWYWSDVYDGRAGRALPQLWAILKERRPEGTAREVVALWSVDELRSIYDRLLRGR